MITIDNNCFSIPQICESGQCFRLDAVSENTYELIAGSRYLKIGLQPGEHGEREVAQTGSAGAQPQVVHRKVADGRGPGLGASADRAGAAAAGGHV